MGVVVKYDILSRLRTHLYDKHNSKNTADRYYFAIKKLFENIQFDKVTDIDNKWLENEISKVSQKSKFSAVKNGLKALKEIEKTFNLPDEKFFKSLSLRKKNRTKKNKTIIKDTNNRKINAIKEKKYRYAYRLMQASGLRVSEVAAIKKDDIKITGNNIEINITKAKGGKNQKINFQDDYLAEKLTVFISNKSNDENIFPAAQTLKNKANKLKIECHDQRRIAAIEYKKKLKKQGLNEHQANEATKDFLRHDRFSTTKRYLFNRKLKLKDKKSILALPAVYDDLNLTADEVAKEVETLKKLTDKQIEFLNNLYEAEPAITQSVLKTLEQTNGTIVGLENRAKKPSSIYEKIHGRRENKKINKMNDILRYTGIYSDDNLADGTNAALDEFINNGFKVKAVKNTWDNTHAPYKGINTILVDPSGQTIEVQFHTKESFELKNGELHRLYEKYRTLGDFDDDAVKINKKMIKLSKSLNRPRGIERVKNK